MAMVMFGVFLLGPFLVLGIWLWLRSRRDPIDLLETFDIGRVMGQSFAVFGREGLPIAALSALLIGVPQMVWLVTIRSAMRMTAAGTGAPADRLLAMFGPHPGSAPIPA